VNLDFRRAGFQLET